MKSLIYYSYEIKEKKELLEKKIVNEKAQIINNIEEFDDSYFDKKLHNQAWRILNKHFNQ